jgi:hypothetical protein
VLLATTFERAFKLEQPEMWKQVEGGWTRVETLPATSATARSRCGETRIRVRLRTR